MLRMWIKHFRSYFSAVLGYNLSQDKLKLCDEIKHKLEELLEQIVSLETEIHSDSQSAIYSPVHGSKNIIISSDNDGNSHKANQASKDTATSTQGENASLVSDLKSKSKLERSLLQYHLEDILPEPIVTAKVDTALIHVNVTDQLETESSVIASARANTPQQTLDEITTPLQLNPGAVSQTFETTQTDSDLLINSDFIHKHHVKLQSLQLQYHKLSEICPKLK